MSLFDAATQVYNLAQSVSWQVDDDGDFVKKIPIYSSIAEFRNLEKKDFEAVCVLLYIISVQQLGKESGKSIHFSYHSDASSQFIIANAGSEEVRKSCLDQSSAEDRSFFSARDIILNRESRAWCMPEAPHPTLGKIVLGHTVQSHGRGNSIWYPQIRSLFEGEPFFARQEFDIFRSPIVLKPALYPNISSMLPEESRIVEIYVQQDYAAKILCDYIGLDLKAIGITSKDKGVT